MAGLALPAVVAHAVEVVDQVEAATAAVAGIGEAVVGIWRRGRRSAGGPRRSGRAARRRRRRGGPGSDRGAGREHVYPSAQPLRAASQSAAQHVEPGGRGAGCSVWGGLQRGAARARGVARSAPGGTGPTAEGGAAWPTHWCHRARPPSRWGRSSGRRPPRRCRCPRCGTAGPGSRQCLRKASMSWGPGRPGPLPALGHGHSLSWQ